MFKHLKTRKKLDKSNVMKEAQKIDYDKDGRVEIDVGLKCADDFFSPYSYKTYEMMNLEVDEYINMREDTIPNNEEISLNIYTETPTTNEEKRRIRQTVKRHHAEELIAVKRKLKHNLILGLFCSFVGLLILLAEAILYHFVTNMYLDTVMAVIGWLFLWDGLEIIFYERGELKERKIRSYRLMNAKVHVRMYSKTIQREYGIGEFEDED